MQSALLSGRSWLRTRLRAGPRFRQVLAEIDLTQWYDAAALRRYQSSWLSRTLTAAAREVPHYRRELATWRPDSDPFDALSNLPIQDKAVVRAAGRHIFAEGHAPNFKSATSGTSGAPLALRQTLAAIVREHAMLHRQLLWAGWWPGERHAWLRGDMIVPSRQSAPPFWRSDWTQRQLLLSSYHLSEQAAPSYLEALRVFDPKVIQAYPSSIGYLAAWLQSKGRRYGGRSLRGVVTSSETLGDDVRRCIEQSFGCPVFDWYGQTERVAAIGTCEHGAMHIIDDYSVVELLPAQEGLYEIVGTAFANSSMPLLRYRTGDLVELPPPNETCPCGRSFRLVRRVLGRADDVVKLPDGRRIGRLDHVFKGARGIIEAQIRQEVVDAVAILVVPGADFDPAVARLLESNLRERIGGGIEIAVTIVASLPRTANGKLKGVVCLV